MVQNLSHSELAEKTGVARSTLWRYRRGRTKKLQRRTQRRLEGAGVRLDDLAAGIPENVDAFGLSQDLRYVEVKALLQSSLKPVSQMTPKELEHIYDSARRFPGLYGWPEGTGSQE